MFLLLLGLVHAMLSTCAAREPRADRRAEPPYGTRWLVDLARVRAERYRRLRRPPEAW